MSNRKAKAGAGLPPNYGPVSSSSRVPSFKPPSFYAAAAGLKYSPNANSHMASELNTAAHDRNDLTGSVRSYPTGDNGHQEIPAGRSRSNSFSRSFSRAPPKQQRQDQSSTSQSRRRSQMAEIPLLETQLLPSLRDTIDRMTHPPQNAQAEDARSHPYNENPSFRENFKGISRPVDVHVDRSGASSIPPSPYSSASPSFAQKYQSPSTVSPHIPSALKTPRQGASSASHTPRMDTRSPAHGSSKLPAAVRNATSLRADAALSPTSVPIPPSPLVAYSPGNTPRSARPDVLPAALQPGRSPVSKLRSPNVKSPSRLPTPGSVYASSSSQPPPTPRVHQTSAPFQSLAAQRSPRSNIPRYDDYTTDSGSELEHEYRRTQDSGRLVVANGRISPSSSESTLEDNSRDHSRILTWNARQESHSRDDWQDTRPSPRNVNQDSRTDPSRHVRPQARGDRSIGLGLRLESERVTHPVSDDDEGTHAQFRQDHSRRPRDNGEHNRRHRGNGQPQPERGQRRESGMSDGRRRREALLGLVTGLEHEYGVQPSDTTGSLDQENQSIGGVVMTESMEMEQYAVQASRSNREVDRGHSGDSRNRRERLPKSDARVHNDSRFRGENNGQDRRSSSVPPGSRSTSRPDGSFRSQQDPRSVATVKQSKARHRTSMSMDQSRNGSSLPSSRSKRTSGHVQRPAAPTSEGRPTTQRRDSEAREREAFGIPASLSYGGQDDDGAQHTDARLPGQVPPRSPSETEVSALGDDLASSEATTGGLSRAAEALFDKISGTVVPEPDARDTRYRTRQPSSTGRHESREERRHTRTTQQLPQQYRPPSISESASAPSIYEPEPDPRQTYDAPHTVPSTHNSSTWRSTVRPQVYNQLLSVYGAAEMERQEVLFRFYHAQQELCQRLQSTVRIFVLPLRRQHSKNWIPGVPTRVGRLFDWLEDIVNLHHAISEALRDIIAPWNSESPVVHVAKSVVAFVARLEVYQPYLVRYEEVRQLVVDHTSTRQDEFGEFVKLQQRRKECNGYTLADLLDLPVAHLSTCIETFEQLWRLTTSEHPDHLAAFSLYHSARMMLHVLWEVKSREEEYEYVKSVSSRIEGILPSVQLATRERRLLWHGDLTFQVTKANSRSETNITSAVLSPPSGTSSGRGGTYSTPAIVLSPCPEDGCRADVSSSSKLLDVRVFVLTDVVVIGRILAKPRSSGAQWKLVADVGTSRILNVLPQNAGPGHVELDLLPLKQTDLQSGLIPDDRNIITVRLSPSSRSSKEESGSMQDALRRCYAHTLRSLSFPSHSGQYLPHGPHVDLEQDTQKSVMSILNSGLPLPKSPSIQLADPGRAGTADPSNDHDKEREERGWWALRFQQVLREVQRQDPMMSLQGFPTPHTT